MSKQVSAETEARVVKDLAAIFQISEEEVRRLTDEEAPASALPGLRDQVGEADSIKDDDLLKGRVLAVCQHCDFVNDVTPHNARIKVQGRESPWLSELRVLAIENDDGPYIRGTLIFHDAHPIHKHPEAVALLCAHCGNLLHKGGVVRYDINPVVVRSIIPEATPYEIEQYD